MGFESRSRDEVTLFRKKAVKCPKCLANLSDDSHFCRKCGTQLTPIPDAQIPTTQTLETPIDKLCRGSIFAGRYEIIDELGSGGMGTVYRVEDTKIHEEIALKLIRPDIAVDKIMMERFSNELKITRKIRHKNVCQMYDLGETGNVYYITMEYVSGQNLSGLIKQTGRLAVSTSLSIAKQVSQGLAAAHRLGIVHRDLKPSNIMIDKEGMAQIMDFGLARSLKTKSITGKGVMIGTPEYMSPEQAEGRDVDFRSDIYSLGVILYKMLSGKVPFEGDSAFSIALKHKNEDPKDPRDFNPNIPMDLNQLILKYMTKNRKKRCASTGEVISELAKIKVDKADNGDMICQPQKRDSIAVLPFVNMSADPEQEYFCDGVSEEIINTLTQVNNLRVASRTTAFSFKGKDIDVRDIGKKLNVDAVLEGSVRKAGQRLKISAQLICVATGFHLWSHSYEREMTDVFLIQGEIAHSVSVGVGSSLKA